MRPTIIIGIDPGVGGGIAIYNTKDGRVEDAIVMPETDNDIADLLIEWTNTDMYEDPPPLIVIERVGGYMPGNSGPSAAKFARHCGVLDGCLASMNRVIIERPLPRKWMLDFIGTIPKDLTERKNKIKAKAQDMCPGMKVTLKTADAIGLAIYGARNLDKILP